MQFYTSFHQYGNTILLRGYEFGNRFQKKVRYEPTLYVQNYGKYQNDPKNTEYRTLDGTPVFPIMFDGIREAKEFIKTYENTANFNIYGSTNYSYCCINEKYPGQIEYDQSLVSVVYLDIETDSSNGFPDIKKANRAITAITMRRDHWIVTLGLKDYTPHYENVEYIKCADEHTLLSTFLDLWESRRFNPDILTGWNIEDFDVPYLIRRIMNLFGEEQVKRLSPWKLVEERTKSAPKLERGGQGINDRNMTFFEITGVSILDYMKLYKKFSFSNQESYALNFIAEKDLGEQKLDYSMYGSLHEFYVNDHQKFIEYNIHDVNLVVKLEDKHRFIEQVMAMAYDAKVNYADTFATVRPWDTIIHNYLLENKIVISPTAKPNDKIIDIVGGYVKDPIIGMHDWVVSFDLTSLYPHLIMQYNISPETFRGKIPKKFQVDDVVYGAYDEDTQAFLKENDVAICPNSCVYSRDRQGFLPALMEKMFNDRAKYKKLMLEAKKKFEETKDPEWGKKISAYHNLQLAKKIQLNSAYGALANKYFRWFSVDNAEAITTAGQLSIKWIEMKINEYLNKIFKTEKDYVIAIDTDSMYLNLSGLVDQVFREKRETTPASEIVAFLDKACANKIEPLIAKCYDELGTYVNAYQQKMHMKRESIADKAVWTGKKHYVMNVYDEEGVVYSTPKLKMVGIEAVRSSTPKVCRDNIKKALSILMNEGKDPLLDFIDEFRSKWMKMDFESIAFPRGVKMIYFRKVDVGTHNERTVPLKYDLTTGGLPMQVRAALVYNALVKSKNLTDKYQLIMNESKIKFCYLMKPNPIGHNVIGSPGALPHEFDIGRYIDYDTQFDKAFLDPIKSITDVLKWDLDRGASTLEGFFS